MNKCRTLTTVLLCLSFFLHTYSSSNSLFAASILYVDLDASGANSGNNWANAYTDLQAALTHARNDNSVSEIWVAEGTYFPTASGNRSLSFDLVEGVKVYGGFEGTEDELSKRDFTVHLTILSGDIGTAADPSDNSYHVVSALSLGGDDTTLDGFTITAGNANGLLLDQFGGGMLLYNGVAALTSLPQIINCIFDSNRASYGGALAQYADNGALIESLVSFCYFHNDTASIRGGALYHYKGVGADLITDYHSSIFYHNFSVRGGVLYSNGSGGMTVDPATEWNAGFFNCVLYDNSANYGGVFYFTDSGSSTHLLARNCTMYNNSGINNSDVLLLNLTSSASIGNCIIIACDDPFDDFNFLPNQLNVQNSVVDFGGGPGSYTDPGFVDEAGRDFRLEVCSAIIDAGINFGTPANFDPEGNPRLYGSQVDIGAYEFVGTSISLPIANAADTDITAEDEFTDINGWTHYYSCSNESLVLSVFKNGQDIGTIGQNGFEVLQSTTSGYGTSAIDLSNADYRNGSDEWLVMNRFWQINNSNSLSAPVKVRYYFADQDYADLQDGVAGNGGLLTDPRDLNFFKVSGAGISPLAADVLAQGGTFEEYVYADTASLTHWTNGNFNGQRYAEIAVSSFSGGSGGYLNQVALPVELLSFTGKREHQYIHLNWETTVEENSDYFIIEKSADAEQFFPLSRHAAQGYSTFNTQYAAVDESPFLGANYYRLKQVDRDGKYYYSDIIAIFIGNEWEKPLVFPNPTEGSLTLQLPELLEGKVKIEVWDALRRVVWAQHLDEGSSHLIPLELNGVEPGLYVLKVTAKRYRSYTPVVIQKK